MVLPDSRPRAGCWCRCCVQGRAELCLCCCSVGLRRGRTRARSSAWQPAWMEAGLNTFPCVNDWKHLLLCDHREVMGMLRRGSTGVHREVGFGHEMLLLHFPVPKRSSSTVGVSALCSEQDIKHRATLLATRSQLMTAVWTEA